MPPQKITLFDLPSPPPTKAWSLNPWKTRLALNYKSLPYSTTWLEYPSIAPHLSAANVPPNPTDTTPYTIPAIQLPDGRYVMDSRAIATELERLHPEPSLHLDSALTAQVEALAPRALAPLVGVVMPRVPRTVLNPVSAEYFERTRAERFGMPLSELEKVRGGEAAWGEVEGPVRELGLLLRERGGPFFMGGVVSYGDFIVVGALRFMRRIGGGIYERMVGLEPCLGRLYEACAEWLERDDH